jgi:hypothetical protein
LAFDKSGEGTVEVGAAVTVEVEEAVGNARKEVESALAPTATELVELGAGGRVGAGLGFTGVIDTVGELVVRLT